MKYRPIVLVRHGVAMHNLASDDACPNVYDAPLCAEGYKEASYHGPNTIALSLETNWENIVVFTSPLTRCLQTCMAMTDTLKTNSKRLILATPLLIEEDPTISSAGRSLSKLKKEFPKVEWIYFDGHPNKWWSSSFRMTHSRYKALMQMLQDHSTTSAVIAFTHGTVIQRITKYSVHNCEAVASYDGGRTWHRHYIGRSPIRTDPTRERIC